MLQEINFKRECLGCQVDISHMNKTFKYCSKKCRIAPRFRGTYCIQCGKEIIVDLGSSHRVKHCSTSCSRQTIYERNNSNLDNDFFEKPNLENSYWAGFIAADGYISDQDNRMDQLVITLKSTDRAHLEKIQRAIGAGAIQEYDSKNELTDRTYSKARYRVSSDKICSDISKTFGVHPRKTFTLEPPPLEGDLAYAFIAGYIDGDGCYDKTGNSPRLRILGTYNLLSWINEVYNIGKTPSQRSDENIFRVELHGRDALRVRDSFKNLNLPLLERKKSRWEELGLSLEIL